MLQVLLHSVLLVGVIAQPRDHLIFGNNSIFTIVDEFNSSSHNDAQALCEKKGSTGLAIIEDKTVFNLLFDKFKERKNGEIAFFDYSISCAALVANI